MLADIHHHLPPTIQYTSGCLYLFIHNSYTILMAHKKNLFSLFSRKKKPNKFSSFFFSFLQNMHKQITVNKKIQGKWAINKNIFYHSEVRASNIYVQALSDMRPWDAQNNKTPANNASECFCEAGAWQKFRLRCSFHKCLLLFFLNNFN